MQTPLTKTFVKPTWLRKKVFYTPNNQNLRNIFQKNGIHTICEEGRCPNRSECHDAKTATFLLLGDLCTRSCKFCSVSSASKRQIQEKQIPLPEEDEPDRIAQVVREIGLEYVVLTSVDRDDLPDKGAGHFVKTLRSIRLVNSNIKREVLTPDFQGDEKAIQLVLSEKPDVFNHNMETVESISPKVRKQSSYALSLKVLEIVKQTQPQGITKSGIMLGLGETEKELYQSFRHLRSVGCDILTIGQYLQPTKRNIPVQEYIPPEQFELYRKEALKVGFPVVQAGPFVRSSYRSHDSYQEVLRLRRLKKEILP